MRFTAVDKSSRVDIALEDQRAAWNLWNTQTAREKELGEPSRRQAETIERWLETLGRRDLSILDAGCGMGWMSARLLRFGTVLGIDLADEVIERASQRVPGARFEVCNLANAAVESGPFDVVVSLEVLSHVADQRRFVGQLANELRPGGLLMLATQNRPVLERCSSIGGPVPGQIRRWVDAAQLQRLLAPHFVIEELISVHPVADEGIYRFVNSRKLNRLIGVFVGATRLADFKERRLLLGHTLVVRARRKGVDGR